MIYFNSRGTIMPQNNVKYRLEDGVEINSVVENLYFSTEQHGVKE